METNQKLIYILQGIIIADALASPLDNLSAEHIRNTFDSVHDYTDPTPALKHKLHTWKKPALYTALSQYVLLLCAINTNHHAYTHQPIEDFISIFGDSSDILRHPLGMLHHPGSPYNAPTAETLIIMPSLFFLKRIPNTESIINMILTHNRNAATCVASCYYYFMLDTIIRHQLITLDMTVLNDIATRTLQFVSSHSSELFVSGGNPQDIHTAAQDLYSMMQHLPLHADENQFTNYCLSYTHRWSKHTFTRLTVNHAFTLLPLAIYCILTINKDNLLFATVHKGGNISLLAPLVATIACSLYGEDAIPHHLMQNIINKKRILQLLDLLRNRSITTHYLTEFFQNEKKLTQKEKEELESKLKHITPKRSSTKKSQDPYKDMTTHVVESWTKLDKAKWKKERRKR
jgi:hypothetical protein